MRSSAFRKRFSSAPAFDFMDWARSSRAGETAAVLSLDSAAGKTDGAGRWTAADQRPAQVGSRQRQNLDSRRMLIHSSASKPTRGAGGVWNTKRINLRISADCAVLRRKTNSCGTVFRTIVLPHVFQIGVHPFINGPSEVSGTAGDLFFQSVIKRAQLSLLHSRCRKDF